MSEFYNYGLELEREFYTNVVEGRTLAYRMVVRVTDYHNVDPNIFLYRRDPDAVVETEPSDTFVAVCTPVDLETYAVGAPVSDHDHFRVAEVDLVSRNAEQLETAWDLMKIDRDELIRTLQALDEVTATETSVYGYIPGEEEPEEPGSSGSGSSLSSEGPTCSPSEHTVFTVTSSTYAPVPAGTELTLSENDPEPTTCYQVYTNVDDDVKLRLSSPTGFVKSFELFVDTGGGYELFAFDEAGDDKMVALDATNIIVISAG